MSVKGKWSSSNLTHLEIITKCSQHSKLSYHNTRKNLRHADMLLTALRVRNILKSVLIVVISRLFSAPDDGDRYEAGRGLFWYSRVVPWSIVTFSQEPTSDIYSRVLYVLIYQSQLASSRYFDCWNIWSVSRRHCVNQRAFFPAEVYLRECQCQFQHHEYPKCCKGTVGKQDTRSGNLEKENRTRTAMCYQVCEIIYLDIPWFE